MNAGAFGKEIGPLVNRVTVLDSSLELKNLYRSDLTFGYRFSSLKELVLEVELGLKFGNENKIKEQMEKNFRLRKKNQPQGCFTAGSVFKNPPEEKAFRLIELAGAKGLKKGAAMVSPKHANFIVNLGGARAADIFSLIEEVRERVWNKHGVLLELEIELLGRF
jgi:UDP-N-acetylmuramate dehydrogenase